MLEKQKRNVGLDLLRMLLMLLVVLVHVIGKGGIQGNGKLNYYTVKLLQVIGLVAVPTYAMVSGYVGINAKRKISSIINLLLLGILYSFLFSLIFFIIKPNTISVKELLFTLFPNYWYLLCYLGLFLLMPLLNAGIKGLTKRQLFGVIIGIFVVFSLTSIFLTPMSFDIFGLNLGYATIWLACLYIIGAYVKLYGINVFKTKIKLKWFLVLIVSIILTFLSKVVCVELGYGNFNVLMHYLSPTTLISAVSILIIFSKLNFKEKSAKRITWSSQFAFSVYLIHESKYIELNLMTNRFAFVSNYFCLLIPIVVLGISIAIYLVCMVIDIIRLYVFKALRINKFCSWLGNKIEKATSFIHAKVLKEDPEDKDNEKNPL